MLKYSSISGLYVTRPNSLSTKTIHNVTDLILDTPIMLYMYNVNTEPPIIT